MSYIISYIISYHVISFIQCYVLESDVQKYLVRAHYWKQFFFSPQKISKDIFDWMN